MKEPYQNSSAVTYFYRKCSAYNKRVARPRLRPAAPSSDSGRPYVPTIRQVPPLLRLRSAHASTSITHPRGPRAPSSSDSGRPRAPSSFDFGCPHAPPPPPRCTAPATHLRRPRAPASFGPERLPGRHLRRTTYNDFNVVCVAGLYFYIFFTNIAL